MKKSNRRFFISFLIIIGLLFCLGIAWKNYKKYTNQVNDIQQQTIANREAISKVKSGELDDNSIKASKLNDDIKFIVQFSDGTYATAKIIKGDISLGKISSGAKVQMPNGTTKTIRIENNTISDFELKDGSVVTAKIADNAVTTLKLADGSITDLKIVDGSVTSSKIANGQIQAIHLDSGSVITAKVADGAIIESKIADGSVTTSKLADNSIINAKIANDSVTGEKINNQTITADKIATGSITGTQIASDGSVVKSIIGNSIVNVTNNANGSYSIALTQSCANGQILKFDSVSHTWGCAEDSGTGGASVDSVNGKTGTVSLITDDITEGSTNLYFTDERTDDRVNALILNGNGLVKNYDDSANSLTLSVNAPTCTGNDKLVWNGTAFACSADIDTDTDTNNYDTAINFNASTGELALTRNGLSGLSVNLDGRYLTSFSESDAIIGNEVTNATANKGLARAGSGTAVDPYTLGVDYTSDCSGATKKILYNGSTGVWSCGDDIDTDTDTNTTYTADGDGMELSGTTFALELNGASLQKNSSGLSLNLDNANTWSAQQTFTSGATAGNINLSNNSISATNDSGLTIYDNNSNGIAIKDGGNVGVGVNDPSAVLHLKAGTALAGSAPLKFTSGTLLSTPEAGALEYDGTDFYFTASNGQRKTFAIADAYSAGNGLSLSGSQFSIKLDGSTLAVSGSGLKVNSIGSAEIIDGSIANGDISSSAGISWSKISKTGSSLADLTTRSAGDLTSGNLDIARMPNGGSWNISSNLNIDSNTLVVDQANNRVGINTSTPLAALDLNGDALGLASTSFAKSQKNIINPASITDTGKTLPTNLGYANLAIVGDYIYLYGGHNGSNQVNTIFKAPVTDPTNWVDTGATLPASIESSQTAIIGNYVYIFGGWNVSGNYAKNTIYYAPISNPTKVTDTGATLPITLGFSHCAIIGDYVYLFGGDDYTTGYISKILRAPLTNPTSWVDTGATLPASVGYGQLNIIGDYVYIFGGQNNSGAKNSIYRAPLSNPLSWSDTGSTLPVADAYAQSVISGDYIYLYGGGSKPSYYNSIYRAPLSNPLSWSDTGSTLPNVLAGTNVAVIGDNIYLFGGVHSSIEYTSSILKAGITGSSETSKTWKYALDIDKYFNQGLTTAISTNGTGKIGIATTDPKADLQIKDIFGLFQQNIGANGNTYIGRNVYHDGTAYKRLVDDNDAPMIGLESDGTITFYSQTDANATAGSTITYQARFKVSDDGKVNIPSLTPSQDVQTDANSNLVSVSSDIRLKKNIEEISQKIDVLNALDQMKGVYYNWDTSVEKAKDFGDQKEIGLIAQDVEKVLPELVSTDADGYKTLRYSRFCAFLLEALKAQQTEIKDQNTKTLNLENTVNNQGVKIDQISQTLSDHENRIKNLENKVLNLQQQIDGLKN